MVKVHITTRAIPTQVPAIPVTKGFAAFGWVVEVIMPEWPLDRRLFAVGMELAADAEESVLLYPGVSRSDQRVARRRLSSAELSNLRLRVAAVRPSGWMTHGQDKV